MTFQKWLQSHKFSENESKSFVLFDLNGVQIVI